MAKVLVTGGAGYIGSTVVNALRDSGHEPVVLDSLVRGRPEFVRNVPFFKADISDEKALEDLFNKHPDISCTIHCAAWIVIPESVANPYDYYEENLAKSNRFFKILNRLNQKNVVFSSSASIYKVPKDYVVDEQSPLEPISPYARTKSMMENVLQDFCVAYKMRGIALRYFNPIGADPKMRSGIHVQFPSHVLGKLVDTARGVQPCFELTGTQWATRDGTGLRDFFHVWDLAMAHVLAVERIDKIVGENHPTGFEAINLGTGTGVTVRELIQSFVRVYGKPIEVKEVAPRPGDNAGCYASTLKAKRLLNWEPQFTLDQGIQHALEWGEKRQSLLTWAT
jgi:UDP-glucose 4-epimerase